MAGRPRGRRRAESGAVRRSRPLRAPRRRCAPRSPPAAAPPSSRWARGIERGMGAGATRARRCGRVATRSPHRSPLPGLPPPRRRPRPRRGDPCVNRLHAGEPAHVSRSRTAALRAPVAAPRFFPRRDGRLHPHRRRHRRRRQDGRPDHGPAARGQGAFRSARGRAVAQVGRAVRGRGRARRGGRRRVPRRPDRPGGRVRGRGRGGNRHERGAQDSESERERGKRTAAARAAAHAPTPPAPPPL